MPENVVNRSWKAAVGWAQTERAQGEVEKTADHLSSLPQPRIQRGEPFLVCLLHPNGIPEPYADASVLLMLGYSSAARDGLQAPSVIEVSTQRMPPNWLTSCSATSLRTNAMRPA